MYLVEPTYPLTDFCKRCCKNCRLVVEFFLGYSKHDYLAQAYQNGLREIKLQILANPIENIVCTVAGQHKL